MYVFPFAEMLVDVSSFLHPRRAGRHGGGRRGGDEHPSSLAEEPDALEAVDGLPGRVVSGDIIGRRLVSSCHRVIVSSCVIMCHHVSPS